MIWRWFWREWRSPSLLIVWLALTLSVACVLALGNISDRLTTALTQQGRDFIAGDGVLRAAHPVPEAWLQQAKQQGLQVSRQLAFTTMTYANDRPQLAQVKATDAAYPLYGNLETRPANLKPHVGQVLVAPQLLALLNLQLGDLLEVGDASLRISGEILQEPDAGFNPFQVAPKVIIHLADVERTGAVQPGSRLTYRYMFAGSPAQLTRFQQQLEPLLQADQRWYGPENSASLGRSLQRSQQFLRLSALLTLLLSAAAVTVAMTHYCRTRHELIAILKTLGAQRHTISKLIIGQWLLLLLLAALTGSLVGLAFEALLVQMLLPVLPRALPAAGLWPWLWALGALVTISSLVGVRPFRQLLATQPLRVLRQNTVANVWPLRYFLPLIFLTVLLLLLAVIGANPLLWANFAAIVLLALLLASFGWGTLQLLRRLRLKNLAIRLAVSRLLHQPGHTLSQLAAFSLSFMLLALLLLLRGDLLSRWQQQLPADSPNYFLLNISSEQIPPLTAFLQQHQIKLQTFYPVVRARLTEINQQPATQRAAELPAGAEALTRELNLTWLAELPAHNPLLAGHWPPANGEVSIDQGLAQRLQLKLGDQLTFTTPSQQFSAKISSLRQVDWESLRPNFYFIFPPSVLEQQPQSWLTSFRHSTDNSLLVELHRLFPTISQLDIGAILQQLDQVLQQVSRALALMVLLVVVCGLLLLMAQVQVGMRQRQQELVVYRILGASKRLLRQTLWCEFTLLGLVAGFTAAIGAEAALALLQHYVFHFPWQPTVLLWWLLPLCSALLLSLCGGALGLRLLRRGAALRGD
ncbi:putative ABC transporter permease subunit YbbP [Serratia microhaemolytica]|uniref:putative ABC transporter permease subunit YbbP n=1 Tax=Serratia microhaemolytica TaxID=2675110 RepID=UPI000FDD3AB1|nr:putative ABC transporter permease subunit YbbP [Serratia microhaemolytica]